MKIMTKREKLDRIIQMMKEIYEINFENIDEKEVNDLYFKTKFSLETMKELKGDKDESN